jgi:hypothetical protein
MNKAKDDLQKSRAAGPEDGAAATAAPGGEENTLQRAATVLRRLKVPAPVGAAVLAEHGLTRTSLVDPAQFEGKVAAWLAAPAGSK